MVTLNQLQSTLKTIFNYQGDLNESTDLREIIHDSIDLGEVLSYMNKDIDLNNFKNSVTVQEFLEVINTTVNV